MMHIIPTKEANPYRLGLGRGVRPDAAVDFRLCVSSCILLSKLAHDFVENRCHGRVFWVPFMHTYFALYKKSVASDRQLIAGLSIYHSAIILS